MLRASHRFGGLVLAALFALTACGGGGGSPSTAADRGCVKDFDASKDYFPVKQTVRHAANFTLTYAKNYQVVTVEQPAPGARPEKYVLVRCGTPAPKAEGDLAGAITVETPIDTLYSASTTHLPFVTELGVLDVLTGVAQSAPISSPQVLERVRSGAVAEYARAGQIDVEKVIGARPDVLMTGGIEDRDYPALRKAGVKVVANAEWLESTPLGRAEWIRLMAALTGTEAKANEVFGRVEQAYTALAAKVEAAPTVTVLPGQMLHGEWAVPNGGSYVAGLIKDAGGTYPWASTKGTGSTTLDLEAVLAKGRDAKVWLANVTEWKTLADVREDDPRYAEFTAFKTGAVWSSNKALGPGGGNDFYERGVARPDLILADLVAILHPDLAPGHTFTFYRRLAS
ncbi:ABC transporter substrate-binding protein [Actinomadura keratinilytica]|jgi:iron complex transport system substrate-binding protein|uniref:ABC transporter substrate-binding protein n=1 Tax=Actinomadura keratinilytica TaxID=547461 RepID=A0ABP7YKG6_9ACTN